MKVVVTGSSSSPGYKLVKELHAKGYTVYALYNTHPLEDIADTNLIPVKLDLRESNKLTSLFTEAQPDIVIHTAALGNVDLCEKDRKLAWQTNVEVTRNISKLALKHGFVTVYLSTDYVFDGEKGLYKEDDIPNPINFYGLTKLIAEEITKNTDRMYIIVRTSSIYGFGMGRTNFGKFLVEALYKGEEVKALTDQWLSPTLNVILAKAIVELIEKNASGTYHIAGERVSRYEFAVRLADKFGFDANLVKPATMNEFKWIAKRPRDSSLDVSKARNILSTNFYSLDYSLDLLYSEWKEYQQ